MTNSRSTEWLDKSRRALWGARPTASQLEVCAVGEVFFFVGPNSNKEFYDTFSVEVGLFDLTVKYGNRLQAMPCYFTG